MAYTSAHPHPAVTVAGAAYRGVGLPDCIAGGRAAAQKVIERLGVASPSPA